MNQSQNYRSMSPEPNSGLTRDFNEQVNLSVRMIVNAHQAKMGTYENEVRNLKMLNEELRGQGIMLQKKASAIELELQDQRQKNAALLEENRSCINMFRKLQVKVERLETVRKAVLSSIQDTGAAPEDDAGISYLAYETFNSLAPITVNEMNRLNHQSPMSTPYHLATTTSQGMHNTQQNQNSNGRNSPPSQNSTQQNEGKAFFRLAKSKLSYEIFQSFLASIRKLNGGEQSKDDTITHARQLFSAENPDLFDQFEKLLQRHMLASSVAQPC